MRVRLMQKVDYWVGVPLCFVVSLFNSLIKLISPKQSQEDPKKILFIELSEMGSAIIAYSALKDTKRNFPSASIYFLIFKANRESCELHGAIPKENILVIDDKSFLRFVFSTVRALLKIRALGIDVAIDLELFSRCTALLSYLSGAKTRIGFHRGTNEGLYRGTLLTHAVPYNPHLHISLNFLALTAALRADPSSVPLVKSDLSSAILPLPQLESTPEESEFIESLLRSNSPNGIAPKNLIVLNPDPGPALPIRGWPMDRFIKVAESLLADSPDSAIVITGLGRSRPYAEAIIHALGAERCLDLTGKTPSLRAVIALLNRSKLLITNDSGPAHLASLTPIHSVVLFGPETPALYGPLSKRSINLFANYSCSPCLSATNHRHTKCNDNLCLKAIGVDEVLRHARNIMQGKPTLSILQSEAA